MKIIPTSNHREIVTLAKKSMQRYFKEYNLNWDTDKRLELYSNFAVYEVVDQELLGYFAIREADNKFFLADIQILPSKQSQGFGARLLTEIINLACSKNYAQIFLKVFKTSPALKFYKRNGFNIVSEEDIMYVLVSETGKAEDS